MDNSTQKPPENTSAKNTEIPIPSPQPTEKTLVSWKSPARVFKRRTKEFWTKTGVIASLFGVILYISEGVMPVILLISLFFLFYILSTIEPEDIEYKITNLGIYIHKDRTAYGQIVRFWFTKENQKELLNLEVTIIPGKLVLVTNSEDENKIRSTLQKFVPEETPEPTSGDKVADWVSQKLQ